MMPGSTEGDGPLLSKKDKVKQRMDNEKYLRAHPELKHMISKAVEQILMDKPETKNLHEELCKFFTQGDLKQVVEQQ